MADYLLAADFAYTTVGNCEFSITGQLVGIDNEVMEGYSAADSPIELYCGLVVDTTFNIFNIQFPMPVIQILQDTKIKDMLGLVVTIRGILLNRAQIANLVTGATIDGKSNHLLGSHFAIIGSPEEEETDESL